MSFREWLAGKICPEQQRRAKMWFTAKMQYWTAHRWLGGFPEACAALEWVFVGTFDHYRPLAAHASCKWAPDIGDFREQLRKLKEKEPAKPIGELPQVRIDLTGPGTGTIYLDGVLQKRVVGFSLHCVAGEPNILKIEYHRPTAEARCDAEVHVLPEQPS